MGIIAPHSPAERNRHNLDETMYNLDGDVCLRATNLFNNWHFRSRNFDGDPTGLRIGLPEQPRGYFVHSSSPSGGRSTLAAQNTVPYELDNPSITLKEPWQPGHSPRNPENAANVAPPSGFDYEVIPASLMGFAPGWYGISYCWLGPIVVYRKVRRQITPPAPFTFFYLPQQGDQIQIILPEPVDKADSIGILLTMPAETEDEVDLATGRFQEHIRTPFRKPEYVMKGPYQTSGRKPPTLNETLKKIPKGPRLKKVRGHRPGRAAAYRARSARVTETGQETASSEWSEEVVVSEAEALQNTYLEIEPGDEAFDPDERLQYYIERTSSPREEFVYKKRSKKGGQSRPTSQKERPRTSGRDEDEADDGEDEVLSRPSRSSKKTRKSDGTKSSQTSPEDQGIEPPTEPLEEPEPVGEPLLNPVGTNDFDIAISYWVGDEYSGEESAPCKSKKVTLLAGETIRIYPHDDINLLRNAQLGDLNADGTPDGWTLTGIALDQSQVTTRGDFEVDAAGVLRLYTNGTRSVPGTSTHQTPLLVSSPIEVNRAEQYTVGGTMYANITAGGGQIAIREYKSDGTSLNKLTDLRTPVVALDSSTPYLGTSDFDKRFGADTTVPFDSDTVFIRLIVQFTGPTRNGEIGLSELFVHRHGSKIRRSEEPDDPREASNPDPEPSVLWTRSSFKMVGPPPSRRRSIPGTSPIDVVNFSNAPAHPSGWTKSPAPGGAGIDTLTNVDPFHSSYYWQITKTSSVARTAYYSRTFTPADRERIAVRERVAVDALPSSGYIALAEIKSGTPNSTLAGTLAYLVLRSSGILTIYSKDYLGYTSSRDVASGIKAGDVLDVELIVQGANNADGEPAAGYISCGVGKNGSRRVFGEPLGPIHYRNTPAVTVQFGPSYSDSPGSTWAFRFDSIVITERGDTLVDTAQAAALEAIPRPDRPYRTPETRFSINFNDNTLGTLTKSATPANTEVALRTTAPTIDGTRYLRVSDQSSSLPDLYVEQAFSPAVSSSGNRFRMLVTQRPTTGGVRIAQAQTAAGVTLAYFVLHSNGDVYLHGLNTDGVTPPSVVRILGGVTNGSILTLELVLIGAGTNSSFLSAWADVNTDGSRDRRQLLAQPIPVNWTTADIGRFRAGLMTDSTTVASATAILDFDNFLFTKEGEVLFRELDETGEVIDQAWAYFVHNTPLRDDLWIRTVENRGIEVRPGESYRGSVWARHTSLPDVAYPYTFIAYNEKGNPVPWPDEQSGGNGCLYGEAGATGTAGWIRLERTFVIPEGCYRVEIHSLDVQGGEFCCQELVFNPLAAITDYSDTVVPEVYFPDTGSIWVVLDSALLDMAPEPISGAEFIENHWLDKGCVLEAPEGTSYSIEWGSSDLSEEGNILEPDLWLADPKAVSQRRYLHVRIEMVSSDDNRLTPIMRSGFPYLDYGTYWDGHLHMPKLLTKDGREFPGGAYLVGLSFSVPWAEYDTKAPAGRTIHHRREDPIEIYEAFSVRVTCESAMRKIREDCMEEDFMIEAHGKRARIHFAIEEMLSFTFVDDPPSIFTPTQGDFAGENFALLEAAVAGADVYENAKLPGLSDE